MAYTAKQKQEIENLEKNSKRLKITTKFIVKPGRT